MPTARHNGVVIAKSDDTIYLEGNHYFPPDSVRDGMLLESPTRTLCPWKGIATYQHITVGDDVLADAAWVYRKPWPLARRIKGYVAFERSVTVDA